MDIVPVDWPLWAITFAEDRFAALGEQPLESTRVYVGYDAANVLPGLTQADRTFGNHPSVVIGGNSYHSKFTAAHEYGHQQTIAALQPSFGPADLDYCYDPATYPSPPNTCNSNHTLSSSEWQAAAAIEGFAHWYASSTWHDVDDRECGGCMSRTGYVIVTDASTAVSYHVPRASPVCPALVGDPCPAGVSNEHDWVSALRTFRLDASTTPGFRTMLRMLEVYYDTGNWAVAEATDAFWVGFDQVMPAHLGASYGDWHAAAQAWRLDR